MRMNIRGFWSRLLILCALQSLTACSYIKGLFPDKERDYQFRTEIAELIVPDDLKSSGLPAKAASSAKSASAAVEKPSASAKPENKYDAPATRQQPSGAKPPIAEAGEEQPLTQATVSNTAVSSLQIDQPQIQAWRLVARALSRQKIEIVERNQERGYFYVKYDPDEIKPADSTLWDEMLFLFGDDPSHEQEYRISLLEVAPDATEVTVQNEAGKTLSSRPATHLLKLITDGINLDLPAQTQENAPVKQ